MAEQGKYTPGPWRVGQEGNFRVYGPDGAGIDSGPVAEAMAVKGLDMDGAAKKRRANAHLIAAAPTLAKLLDTAPRMPADGFDLYTLERWTAEYRAWLSEVDAALSAASKEGE